MDFSRITQDLFIGTQPEVEDYNILRKLGVRLVINMRLESRPALDPHQDPIKTIWLRTIDSPLVPIPMSVMMRGVQVALRIIQQGGKVYTHCAHGIHRGPAIAAAILIAQGYSPEAAMQLIREKRPIADPYAWYIRRRIERFAKIWERNKA